MTLIAEKHRVTPEELLAMPDAVAYELLDGRLVERHASRESSRVAAQIIYLLQTAAAPTGGAEVYGPDLGYQCFVDDPARVRKPDVSAIRLDRLVNIPPDPGYMPIPADLAVEVLSPNDLAYEVSAKVADYLKNGFGVVWVADPHVKTVAVYTADAPGRILREGDEIDAGRAIPGFRCRVGDLFKSAPVPPVATAS
jgi:Uma2 family endonuclease